MKMRQNRILLPWLCLTAILAVGLLALYSTPVASVQEGSTSSLYYIVREGDCLWNISGRLYQDPLLWRSLWQNNPHITDPHWIFPGDPVFLGAPQETAVTQQEGVPSAPSVQQVPVGPTVLHVQRRMTDVALLSGDTIEAAGGIVAGPHRRLLFSFGDEVYVQFGRDVVEPVGARYQVLRADREVRHPKTGDRIGVLHRILGVVEILDYGQNGVARATVVASQEAMEVGDLIREGDLPPKGIASKAAVREVNGTIVASLRSEEEIAQHQVCFIDRGIQDGIGIGDEFWALQAREEVQGFREGERLQLPDERVGLLVVVHAEQKASTALVAESRSSLLVGYTVKARTE